MNKSPQHKRDKKQFKSILDNQPILCDGCDTMISEDIYIPHWQKCSQAKKNKKDQASLPKPTPSHAKQLEQYDNRQQPHLSKQQEVLAQVACNKCGKMVLLTNAGQQSHDCPQREQQCVCELRFPHYLLKQHQTQCDFYKAYLQSMGGIDSSTSGIQTPDTLRPLRSQNQLIDSNLPLYEDNSMHTVDMYYGSNWQGQQSNENNDLLQEFFNMLKPRERLSDRQIRLLKKINYHQQHSDKKCTICQDLFVEGMEVIELHCRHIFHIQCASSWLRNDAICPNCKTKVKAKKIT